MNGPGCACFTPAQNNAMQMINKLLRCCIVIAASVTGEVAAQTHIPGSMAFCLFELPSEDPARRRWINLGIVQYIEATPTELKIAYGGGSFGSGYEVKIPLAKPEDVLVVLEKLRKTAAACR